MSAKKEKGKDLIVYINGVAVLYDESSTINFTAKTADTTSRASQDANGTIWEEAVPISIGIKITGSGFLVNDNPSGGAAVYSSGRLYTALANQTLVYATWKSQDGLFLYGCDCFVMDLKVTATVKDVAKYDYTLQGNGVVSLVPVS